MGEPLTDDAWAVRLHYKPLVRWIWFGGILMALGGILSALGLGSKNASRGKVSSGDRCGTRRNDTWGSRDSLFLWLVCHHSGVLLFWLEIQDRDKLPSALIINLSQNSPPFPLILLSK